MASNPLTYKDAGVDIDAFNSAKGKIRDLARSTYTPGVLSDIGAFGGMFACNFAGLKLGGSIPTLSFPSSKVWRAAAKRRAVL
jgi:phosphoribosylformylglycinamidine cyclo-ligase